MASDRAREAFFASLLARDLRWPSTTRSGFLLVEGAWQSVLGWQPEQLHGWYWDELVHPGDRARVERGLRPDRAGARLAEHDVDLRLALPAGGYRLTCWTFVAGSGTDSIVGLGRDSRICPDADRTTTPSSLLKRRNAELAARLEELEERYTAVERFAGTAAHQLAEPLVIAESSAILVADELGADLDPMLRDRLDAIGRSAARAPPPDGRAAGRRAARAGCRRPSRPVDAELGRRRDAREPRTADRGAPGRVVVGPLPQVQAEPGLLEVVLDNLCPTRSSTARAPTAGSRSPPSAARIAGASRWRAAASRSPRRRPTRIFQPFHRVPGERRVPGVGLGLTICARLMERLGGAIGVEPGADSGNTFWISLPAADEAPA